MTNVKKAGLVIKPHAPSVEGILKTLVDHLEGRGIACVLEDVAARKLGRPDGLARAGIAAASDLVIVLGGDGTLLSVAHEAAQAGVPVMGVNLGRLGFLTEIRVSEAVATLDRFLAGDPALVSPRWLLEARTAAGASYCLNDAVVTKAALARMIELSLAVDGRELTTIKSDGLIVSTPTGSTAYSLSAGGPILLPGVAALCVTPICAHTLAVRPLVAAASSTIVVEPIEGWADDLLVSFDGQTGFTLAEGARVEVRRADTAVCLVRLNRQGYFTLLRDKLNWGDLTEREVER